MPIDHPAGAQYQYWHGGRGNIDDETLERLRAVHGNATELFTCRECDDSVLVVSGDYREQVKSYIRYGPHILCGECIALAFDLPEIPHGEPWWKTDDAD